MAVQHNNLSEKGLWLQAGVIRNAAFALRRTFALNNILKWCAIWLAAQSAGLKFPQAIAHAHSVWQGSAKESPWLVSAARHGADIGVRVLGIFGAITSA